MYGPRNYRKQTSKLKTFVWLGVLAVCVYVGIKVAPILLTEFEFQDAMQTAARVATVNRDTADSIREAIYDEAQKQDIPLNREDIQVTSGAGKITISADYSVTVDLGFYQWTLNFHPSASNSAIL